MFHFLFYFEWEQVTHKYDSHKFFMMKIKCGYEHPSISVHVTSDIHSHSSSYYQDFKGLNIIFIILTRKYL
jgi:hypothetical protein